MKKIFIFVKFFKDELAHKVGNKLSKIEDFKEVRIKNSEIMITGYWASVMLAENFIVDVLEDIVGIEEEYEILAEYAADAEIKDSKKVKDDIIEEEHKIEETPDSWIVDDIYEILKEDGTIYYTENYIGENKDFPNWVFEVKDELIRLQNINESLEEIIKVGEKEWVRTPQDKIEWDKLTEDEKALLSYSNDMGHWFDNIVGDEDLLNQYFDLANRFSVFNEGFKEEVDRLSEEAEEGILDKDEKVFDSKEIKDSYSDDVKLFLEKVSALCNIMDDITELCYRNNDLNNIPGYPEHWKSFDEEANAASNWRDEIKEYIEKIK